MAFINVNKVTLEDSDDIKKVMGNVMLLCASFVYDDIQKKEYNEALRQIEALKYSISQLEYILGEKGSDINDT